LISAAVTFSDWQSYDGIIKDEGGSETFRTLEAPVFTVFIIARMADGLITAYTQNITTPELREDIKAYVGVQYNAVLDLSTKSGSNIY
ncbi:hypothetical protein C8J57DRAFT_1009111, partial [Mycena rebaudengoi]